MLVCTSSWCTLPLASVSFGGLDSGMTNSSALRIAALFGLLAVALGAFGAHTLKDLLARNQTAAIWEKAVFYHFIHAVMLYLLASRTPFHPGPWFGFLAGIVVFSGSLYLLAVTNVRWLGAITPIGGLSFLVGWGWLLIAPSPGTSAPHA
jgi:uncharacterized membrane protein YgdD (TMEM256/DUF423 family)